MASTMLWVSLKGTRSGQSKVSPLLKRQLKSTWTVSPLDESNRMFSP